VIVRSITCPVFVGREHELEAILDARRALSSSRGAVVLVSGDAGIGKSRLLAQFLTHVARDTRPRHMASAECSELTEAPFAPLRELLAKLRGAIPENELPDEALRALDLLAPRRRGVLEAVGPERGLERLEIFNGVVAFLLALGKRRATILTIEDLHFCDRSSLELLAYLTPRIARSRVLIVTTYRSNEVAGREAMLAALARMAPETNVLHVALEPLPERGTRELIGFALGADGRLAARTLDDVVRRSEGNPFFAEELLKDAIERGDRRAPALPLSIRAAIGERLAQFTSTERRIVEYAAVLGGRFDPALLAETIDASIDDVLPTLRRARDLNILVEEEAAGIRFRFRHELTRQAVYADLLIFDVRRTHARLLATLENHHDAERYVDVLAYHAWQARDAAKTREYGERAADAALALRALPEARVFYERALELSTDPLTSAHLSARVAAVAEMQGDLTVAVEHFRAALATYLAHDSYDLAAEMARAIATNRNNLAEPDAVIEGLAFVDRYGDRISRVPRESFLALLARLASILSDRDLAARILARIEAPDELPSRARQNYVITKMDSAFAEGERGTFARLVPDLLATLPGLAPFNAAIVSYTLAHLASWLGESATCERALAKVDEIEARWTFGALQVHGAAIRAERAYLVGNLELAREHCRRALDGSEAKVAEMALALIAPLVAVALDDPSLVTPSQERIFDDSLGEKGNTDTAMILAAGAAWRLRTGRPAEARRALRRAIAFIGRPEPWLVAPLTLGAQYLEKTDLAALQRLIDAPLANDDESGRANVALARAIVARRFGSADEARTVALEAAEGYARLGWPMYEARALETAGDPERALALYERCGSVADIGRLRPAAAAPSSPVESALRTLSAREIAVARMIAQGASNAAIAESIGISVKTIEKHVTSIFFKLGVSKRTQLVALLLRDEA
jgi:DNA-binding CsgD family transcriptional regulator